jgi:hypothetical protein
VCLRILKVEVAASLAASSQIELGDDIYEYDSIDNILMVEHNCNENASLKRTRKHLYNCFGAISNLKSLGRTPPTAIVSISLASPLAKIKKRASTVVATGAYVNNIFKPCLGQTD